MRLGKVLVVGPGEAGKSTLIGALCPDALNLSVRGRTVAMDHASLRRNGHSVSLVGVPGQARFAAVREALAGGAVASVWVHRAGLPNDAATEDLVAQLAADGVPYLVYLNHHLSDQRDGEWVVPRSCPTPRVVVSGNLLHPGTSLERLQEELWAMVHEVLRTTRKELGQWQQHSNR